MNQITGVIPTNPKHKIGHEEGQKGQAGIQEVGRDYLTAEQEVISYFFLEYRFTVFTRTYFSASRPTERFHFFVTISL